MSFQDDASDSDLFTEVDAEQEIVEESPAEDTETTEATDEQEPEDKGAPQGEEAAPAEQQPKDKPAQTKEADKIAAAARRQAEAQATAIKAEADAAKARMDAFAQQHGHKDWAAMEAFEQTQRYINDGIPEETAQIMARKDAELAAAKAELETAKQEKARREQFSALAAEFPETRSMEILPDEVIGLIQQGETPLNAYRAYEIKRLRTATTAAQQNTTTKQKAIGSLKGKAAVVTTADAFLEGLNG